MNNSFTVILSDTDINSTTDLTSDFFGTSPRELSTRTPREVYKEVKNKINKEESRDCDELKSDSIEGSHVSRLSEETDKLPIGGSEKAVRSQEFSQDSASIGIQERDTVLGSPRELSTRTCTGITAQHNKTKSGVKVSVTIQTQESALSGCALELTAELKHSSRLRELTTFECDEDYFAAIYSDAKQQIRDLDDSGTRNKMYIGRLHERGTRSTWWADMFMVGITNDAGVLETVFFYHENDEYQIDMNMQLSPKQEAGYHSTGIYGKIVTKKQRLTLSNASFKPFRG